MSRPLALGLLSWTLLIVAGSGCTHPNKGHRRDMSSDADTGHTGADTADPNSGDGGPTDPDRPDGGAGDSTGCSGTPEPVSWEWAVRMHSSAMDSLRDIAVGSDSIVVTGYFMGDVMTVGPYSLMRSGSESLFIAKLDHAGNVLWARTAASNGYAWGSGLAMLPSGEILVVGSFRTTLLIDGTTLTSAGFGDAFLLRLDGDGNLLDATSFGGADHNDHGTDVFVAEDGTVIICGAYWSDSIGFGGTILTNGGFSDTFVASLDADLDVNWAKRATSANVTRADRVADCGGDALCVIGEYSTNPLTIDGTVLPSNGSNDVYWAKLDAAGNVTWAGSAGGSSYDSIAALVADPWGDLYVTGTNGSVDMDVGGTVLTLHNPNPFSNDLFIAKLASTGEVLWAIDSFQATSEAMGGAIAADPSGYAYAAGGFSSQISFGEHSLSGRGDYDAYLVKLDADGNALWLVGVGGQDDDQAWSVALDARDNIYLAGQYRSPELRIGETLLTNDGTDRDLFLAKALQNPCYR